MKRMLLNTARLGLFTVLGLAIFSGVVLAQGNDNARFALHAKPFFVADKTIPNLCPDPANPLAPNYSPNWDNLPCTDYEVMQGLQVFKGPDVFLVVGQAGLVGIAGASCGVNYIPGGGPGNGIDANFATFINCSNGLYFPNDGPNGTWPAPGGGVRLTWEDCQNEVIGGRGVHAVLGAFYVYAYSDDVLELTPNNNLTSGPELAVTACGGGTTDFMQTVDPSLLPAILGRVQFGAGRDGLIGFTPCNDIVSTQVTTWGNIKSLYDEEN